MRHKFDLVERALKIASMARGGHVLEDDYPTHYLPHVGRQVMADGGMPDPADDAIATAQSIPDAPMPNLMPKPMAPSVPSAEGRVVAPRTIPQAKGVNYRTADDIALPIIEQNKESGLQFPQEESFARLHKKLRREDKAASGKETAGDPLNDRMTIKAPEGSGLPDFVTGKINYGDWIKRHENILNDEEIHHAADWYNRIYDEFKQYYPDESEAKKNMRAWLVAQQNVSPAGAMQNVLLQKEQMKRGVPKELWRAGGMPNPTEAARDVLQNQPIGGGVGQKIADFVDAAEGKNVRSWMANHPDGGEPFVVDIHTARDTGMVDQELLNHLDRLGYNKKDIAKAKIDLTGTPTEAAYENRAAWGRGLTDHLNEIGWKGRSDWTPAEVQAVGWMGMTKLTRNAEEDVQSGLAKNLRRISYETEPAEGSPWHGKYNDRLNSLSPEDKSEVISRLTESAMRHASDLSGIDVHSLVGGVGKKDVAQTLATQGGSDIAANAIGYLLNQGEVWHNRVKPMTSSPKGYAIDFIQPSGKDLADNEKVKDFWNKITEADDSDLFQGFHPIKLPSGEVGIRALIDKGGAKTREKIENALAEDSPIQRAIADFGLDIDMLGHEAEISKAKNNWMENKNGEGYMERLVDLIGADRAASLNNIRQELEGELDAHLQEVGQRQAEPPKRSRKKITKSYGGGVPSYIPEERVEDLARRLITFSYAVAPLVPRVKGTYAEGGSVDDPIASAVDTARNLNPMGFYSAAAEAASKFPQKAPIDQIVNKIKGQPNVKKEELDNANLADAFAGQRSVDPQEVARHLQASVPQISETIYGQYKYKPQKMSIPSFNKFNDAEEVHRLHGSKDWSDMFIGTHENAGEPEYVIYDSSGRPHSTHEDFDEAVSVANRHLGADNSPAQYSEYTIPGGENYREVVMSLPAKEKQYAYDAFDPRTQTSKQFTTRAEAEEFANKDSLKNTIVSKILISEEPYKSSHWQGVDNPLAHLRMSDRDNGKTLHLEELQSDWGQEGRKKGFKDPNAKISYTDAVIALENKRSELNKQQPPIQDIDEIHRQMEPFQEAVKLAALNERGLPSAPYVTDTNQWVDLGLKRALMEAAKGGYDKLVWTPGEAQADRYDLSQQIGSITARPTPDGKIRLEALTPDMGSIVHNGIYEPDKIDDLIGKEMADKIRTKIEYPKSFEDQGKPVELKGLDLKVGGEGMKAFYDKLVPQRLSKLISQHDPSAKIERHSYPLSYEVGTGQTDDIDWEGRPVEEMVTKKVDGHVLHITPKLRAAILKGLPAFKSGGDVGYDRGGSIIRRALDVISKLPQ